MTGRGHACNATWWPHRSLQHVHAFDRAPKLRRMRRGGQRYRCRQTLLSGNPSVATTSCRFGVGRVEEGTEHTLVPLGATICCSTQGTEAFAGTDTGQGADRKVSSFMCPLAAAFTFCSMRLACARNSLTSALTLRCSALVIPVSAASLAFICASSRSRIASRHCGPLDRGLA